MINIKHLLIRYRYVSYLICLILFILVIISLLYAITKTYNLIVMVLWNPVWYTILWEIIGIVDIILVSIVLILFSMGIFELLNLVSEDMGIDEEEHQRRYTINQEIEDLKWRLAKMIIIVLIVHVFKSILSYQIVDLKDILIVSITICILSISIYFISYKFHKE